MPAVHFSELPLKRKGWFLSSLRIQKTSKYNVHDVHRPRLTHRTSRGKRPRKNPSFSNDDFNAKNSHAVTTGKALGKHLCAAGILKMQGCLAVLILIFGRQFLGLLCRRHCLVVVPLGQLQPCRRRPAKCVLTGYWPKQRKTRV